MGEGYFAVAKDGRSWGLTGCTANSCITGAPQSEDAVNICQTKSGGIRAPSSPGIRASSCPMTLSIDLVWMDRDWRHGSVLQ